jgi:hypothetical protein
MSGDSSPVLPDLCEVVPTCPLCGGRMELVYDRPKTKVCVCVDCHTGITVPAEAWAIALARGTVKPKPPD